MPITLSSPPHLFLGNGAQKPVLVMRTSSEGWLPRYKLHMFLHTIPRKTFSQTCLINAVYRHPTQSYFQILKNDFLTGSKFAWIPWISAFSKLACMHLRILASKTSYIIVVEDFKEGTLYNFPHHVMFTILV